MPAIDQYLPDPVIRTRHDAIVRAPADLVFRVAKELRLESLPLVSGIFWLRARLLGARWTPPPPKGLVSNALASGWGVLEFRLGRELVMGAVTQPWRPEVRFTPVPAEMFAEFSDPELVKIAWTIEAEPIDDATTRFVTETRVRATDAAASRKFLRYWRLFGVGILLIRLLMLRTIRREAERLYKESLAHPPLAVANLKTT